MFRTIFFLGIALILVLVVARLVNGRPYPTDRRRELPRLGLLDQLIYLFMLACVLVLAATGIWSAMEGDGPMHGWSLIIHCAAAPPFAIGLAALSVSLAERCRLRCADSNAVRFAPLQNLLFWSMLVAGLIAILSAVLPMTGYGQPAQHWFAEVHKYSALIFFILSIAHAIQFFNARARASPPVVARQGTP